MYLAGIFNLAYNKNSAIQYNNSMTNSKSKNKGKNGNSKSTTALASMSVRLLSHLKDNTNHQTGLELVHDVW